jgi:hypothetical protein
MKYLFLKIFVFLTLPEPVIFFFQADNPVDQISAAHAGGKG